LLASFCLCYVDADDWLRNEEKRTVSFMHFSAGNKKL